MSKKKTLTLKRQAVIDALNAEKRFRKPTHGTCCTCSTCGGDIDYCDCERNQMIERLVSIVDAL